MKTHTPSFTGEGRIVKVEFHDKVTKPVEPVEEEKQSAGESAALIIMVIVIIGLILRLL